MAGSKSGTSAVVLAEWRYGGTAEKLLERTLVRKNRFSTPSDKSDGSLFTKPEGFRIIKDVDFSRWRAFSTTF